MPQLPIYLDNHATTRVDPRVVEAMLPYFSEIYGNAASTSPAFGRVAKDAVDHARQTIAQAIHADAKEIIFTSGATESNNLAIFGIAERENRRGNHIVSVVTEHKAVLDPLQRLARKGFEITLLPVKSNSNFDEAGVVFLDELRSNLRTDTCLVSVMLANNEIGVIQPVAEIGQLCREHGIPFHCDATQAVGKMPVDVRELQVDLMSFSAHKIYGPKGVGALFRALRPRPIRLEPRVFGGGHESGLRSGTLNVPGIVGFAKAIELCLQEMIPERERLFKLSHRLFDELNRIVPGLNVNGPWDYFHAWQAEYQPRLPGNLNLSFGDVDGEALLLSMQDIALSSGAACSSITPEPSHVLRALGLSDDLSRASLRFGIGRFNTLEEIDFTIHAVAEAVQHLRELGGHSS